MKNIANLRIGIWLPALGWLLVSVCATAFSQTTAEAEASANRTWAPFDWPSTPPKDCPFSPSQELTGIRFLGQCATYTDADTWYPSWASDGNLYSPWTDGSIGNEWCGSHVGNFARTGQAKIIGEDPLALKVISLGSFSGPAAPYAGRYPCGSLAYNGVWYYGTYCLGPKNEVVIDSIRFNWPWLGPFIGFRISTDLGETWVDTPHTPANPLFGESSLNGEPVKIGSPHFVDFGQNMQYSPDGKAYLVCHGAIELDPKPRYANCSWITGDQIYLLRVQPSQGSMNDRKQYEFFAGHDEGGKPLWTTDFTKIQPLIDWNNRCGCVTMTYDAPLKKYLMCVTDGWPTTKTMNTFILESSSMTGPWRLVVFMEKFGEQAYFVNFPSKFIEKDGYTAWLCYSASFTGDIRINPPGARYAMTLQKVKLLNNEK